MQSGAIAQSRITLTVPHLVAADVPIPVAVLEPPVEETTPIAPRETSKAKHVEPKEPYVAPQNFMEFYDRYMQPENDILKAFLVKRKVPDTFHEDYRSEFTALLLKPVRGSGLPDRIAYYKPELQAGKDSTQGHFIKFLFRILSHKLSNLRKKDRHEPCCGDSTFQVSRFDDPDTAFANSPMEGAQARMVNFKTGADAQDEFLALDWNRDIRMELDSFKSYLRRHNPSLLAPLDLFMDFESLKAIAASSGVRATVVVKWRNDLTTEFARFRRKRLIP
jgi:hypothetical protein